MQRRWDKSKPPSGPFTLNRDCPQAQGLVAWYPFGGAASAGHLPDLAGSTHLAGVNSPTLDLGPNGEPVGKFVASSNQHFYGALSPITASPLTMAAWCNPPAGEVQTVIDVTGVDYSDFYRIVLVSDKVRANCGTVTGSAQANAITTASYNGAAWNLVGATFAGNADRTVYLNGGNAVNDTTNIIPSGIMTRAYLGMALTSFDAYLQPMNGQIGESWIWNIALSADIHQRLYDPGLRFELWYPLRSRKWFSIGGGGGGVSGSRIVMFTIT